MTFDPTAASRPPRARAEDVTEMIDEARTALDDLELGVFWPKDPMKGKRLPLTAAELVVEAKRWRGTGYPTSTRPHDGGPSTRTDDEGKAMPPLSDPVGELVVEEHVPSGRTNLMRMSANEVVKRVDRAVHELREAVGALLQATPPAEKPLEPGCKNCATIDVWAPVVKGSDRCRWCYDWQAQHQADAPEPLLRAHHDGKRITTRLVSEVMGTASTRGSSQRAS